MLRVNDFERTILTEAMARLIYDDQDYLHKGVPHQKLAKALTSAKENANYPKKFLEGIIQREYENSGLIKMDNGNYSLGPRDGNVDDEIEFLEANADSSNTRMGSSNNSSVCSSPRRGKLKPGKKKTVIMKKNLSSLVKLEAKRVAVPRVGERRKRAKKVFDPSENNLPKRKRGRPVGSLNKTTLKKQCNALSNPIKVLRTYGPKSKCESVGSSNEEETNDSSSMILSDVGNKVAGGVCSVCRQYAKDGNEKLVGCRDCSNKAHPQCLQGDGMLRLRPDNTWQCPHCKTCVVCIETMDAGILTVCHICSDAYHQLCHMPNIPETAKAWNMWECKNCQQTKNSSQNIDSTYIEKVPGSDRSSKLSDKSDSINSTLDRRRERPPAKSPSIEDKAESDPSYSPPYNLKSGSKWDDYQKASPVYEWQLESPDLKKEGSYEDKKDISTPESENGNSVNGENHIMSKLYSKNTFTKNLGKDDNGEIDPSIPDASSWSCIDVYDYFISYFPEHAHIFKEQKIDGASLMVMRRIDVLTYLGLELGPALKIYRHIVKLQSRKDDIKMCWF